MQLSSRGDCSYQWPVLIPTTWSQVRDQSYYSPDRDTLCLPMQSKINIAIQFSHVANIYFFFVTGKSTQHYIQPESNVGGRGQSECNTQVLKARCDCNKNKQ